MMAMLSIPVVMTMMALVSCALLPMTRVVAAKPSVNRTVWAGGFRHLYNPGAGEYQPLGTGPKGNWTWYLNDHTFVLGPDNKWHIFGITHTDPMDPNRETNFAHAVMKDAGAAVNTTYGPVVPTSPDESVNGHEDQMAYDHAPFALGALPPETHLWAPYILHHQGLYYMFYCGGGWNRDTSIIGLATSPNLWNWTRVKVLFTGGVDGRDPMVLDRGESFATKNGGNGRFVIYYTGTNPDNATINNVSHVHYYRLSDDLVNWSETPGISFNGGYTGYNFGGPTESPFVIQRGPNSYYLLTGSWGNHYRLEHFFWSSDALNFGSVLDGSAMRVGTVDTHAAEIVRDRNGEWFISTCGWGQHGVFLAPLYFADGADKLTPQYPVAAVAPPYVVNTSFLQTSLQGPFNKYTVLYSNHTTPSTGSDALAGADAFLNTSTGIVIGDALHEFQFLSSTAARNTGGGQQDLQVCTTTMQIITKDGNACTDTSSSRAFFNTTASFLLYSVIDKVSGAPTAVISVDITMDSGMDANPNTPPMAYFQIKMQMSPTGPTQMSPLVPIPWIKQSVPFSLFAQVNYKTWIAKAHVTQLVPTPTKSTTTTTTTTTTNTGIKSLVVEEGSTSLSSVSSPSVSLALPIEMRKRMGGTDPLGRVGIAIRQGSAIFNDVYCNHYPA